VRVGPALTATTATVRRTLIDTVEAFGYIRQLRRQDVRAPGSDQLVDIVAFTQPAPQDLRTAALVGHVSRNGDGSQWVRDVARTLAAPFALVGDPNELVLFGVGARSLGDTLLHRFPADHVDVGDDFRRALDPRAVSAAKRGARQLSLFPIDVRLLDAARGHSVETLTKRVEGVFHKLLAAEHWPPAATGRVVIGSLASVIIRDKYGDDMTTPVEILNAALRRHADYFKFLERQHEGAPAAVEGAIADLAEGVDYSAIDARSINMVYEHLMVTPELRKEFGIFYTPTEFANEVLEALPIETIAPEERLVLDPACGSGNLLLAAQERMEGIAPGSWTTPQTHDWLKAHVFGWDIDPVSVEIGRLSLLLSALPLGNNWHVERVDLLGDAVPEIRPTIIVSNPPWHNPRGKRQETAGAFINRSVGLLASDGLLACVLPATWLTSSTARNSRELLYDNCEVFEVWRLPRDLFAPDARFGCAVVFAKKGRNPKRSSYAFRWIGSGKVEREAFLNHHISTYRSLAPIPIASDGVGWGPVQAALAKHVNERVSNVANVVSGVVQSGTPSTTSRGGLRVLPRGAPYTPYGQVDLEATILVRSILDFSPSGRDASRFGRPQVLVQAHRNPDTPWRVRPLLDPYGVIPANSWHAIIPKSGSPADSEALVALLASGIASVWVHSQAATLNIPKTAFESFPLPAPWSAHVTAFARLGARLVRAGPTAEVLRDIENLAFTSYKFDSTTVNAVERILAISIAPEGRFRYDLPVILPEERPVAVEMQPGAVLGVDGVQLRIWTVSGPEEGQLVELPEHLPGWLAVEGAVFDVAGSDPATARYYFHRASYRRDDELFGLSD